MTDPAPLRRPDPARLFRLRAARLEELAPGHAAGPYLSLLARLARAQEVACRAVRPGPPAAPGALALERARGAPEAGWRDVLRVVLGAAAAAPQLPPQAREVIARLEGAAGAELDARAGALLADVAPAEDPAAAPFVGAALQAWFTARAAALDRATDPGAGSGCPVCGFAPVAAVVGAVDRLRYATCGLCATEWYVPRVRCTRCRETAALSYVAIEGGADRGQAEACGACRAYLKVFDRAESPRAEACADDAATLVLDLLLAREGWRRAGRNLLGQAGEPG